MLVLTTFDLDEYAFAALRAGASGFLLKDVPPAELAGAIRAVAAGDAVVSPRITRRLLDRISLHTPAAGGADDGAADAVLAALTDREREVFGEVAHGLSNAEIAARLHLSEATVKTHISRVLAKLRLRDRVQLVIFAYEQRLLARGVSRGVSRAQTTRRPVRPVRSCSCVSSHGEQGVGRHRPGEVPALHEVAVHGGQQLPRVGVLDALGDDLEAQARGRGR